jgi:hypothetical protein
VLEHIPRWTHASIKDYIKKNLTGMPLFVEGEDDRNPDHPFFGEIRIDGPILQPYGTKGEWYGEVEININLTVKKDEKYVHVIQDKMGLAVKVLANCIPIRRIGSTDTAVDTGVFVAHLQMLPDDNIEVNNFGQVDPTLRIQQASVEAHYRMQLFIPDTTSF